MGCGEEGFRAAECTQRQGSPVLYAVETALNQIAGFVERFGVSILDFAVFARRYAGPRLAPAQPFSQVIRIISTVCNHQGIFGESRLKALFCVGYIGFIPTRNDNPDRPAHRITHQMQFRIQPAFGQSDGAPVAFVFLTPLAAIRWVFTCVASSMSVRISALSCAKASNIRSKTPASAHRL